MQDYSKKFMFHHDGTVIPAQAGIQCAKRQPSQSRQLARPLWGAAPTPELWGGLPTAPPNRPKVSKKTSQIRLILFAFLLLLAAPFAHAETRACAHRGDTAVAPENTIPAFESAVRKGAHMIEFDVYASSDDRLIVIHDGTVDRTTNGEGKVNEMTFDELRALDAGSWFAPAFAGAQLPTLRETLAVIPPNIKCNVHLKNGPGIAEKAAMVIAEMGRIDQCFLACTEEQAEEAQKRVPMINICNMSRQGGGRDIYIKRTLDMQAEYIQLAFTKGTDKLKDEVQQLHDEGVIVNWFGASEEAPIRVLAEAGIDYILTDNLDLCLQVLADYGTQPLTPATAAP